MPGPAATGRKFKIEPRNRYVSDRACSTRSANDHPCSNRYPRVVSMVAARRELGAVEARLLYMDRRVQFISAMAESS